MSAKHRKPEKPSSANAPSTGHRRLAFLVDEGPALFVNAWAVSKTRSGVLIRSGYIDPHSKICLTLVHVTVPIVALCDVLMGGEPPSAAIMAKWASLPADLADPSTQFQAFSGTIPSVVANGMIPVVSPLGARMSFQWVDPHGLTRDDLSDVKAVQVVTLRMPPEVCGKLWLALSEIAQKAPADSDFAALQVIDARFGASDAAGNR